jgi:mannitol-1-phosphate/altronate dehydrogenase
LTVLTGETLARLNADVSLPRYDRRHVTTGIVHIGVGNFHRSHQAMYIDTLMNCGAAMDWGICGIGLQPSNRRMRDVLAAQDGLYTLVLRHSDGSWEARVIGSIVGYLFAPDDPEAAIDGRPPLEDVGVQIVSDVEPYELMKLRLLNASHQALCYPGYLVGYRLVHDVTTDPHHPRRRLPRRSRPGRLPPRHPGFSLCFEVTTTLARSDGQRAQRCTRTGRESTHRPAPR